MNDHIAKPIDEEALWATLSGWIAPAHAQSKTGGAAFGAVGGGNSLHGIAGLDAGAGLRRVAGDRKLYRRVLGKFAAGQRQFAPALEKAMDDGDRATAERLAHTLKGVAAQIGAEEIRAQAARLEQLIALDQDLSQVDEVLVPLAAALAALIDRLDRALANDDATAA